MRLCIDSSPLLVNSAGVKTYLHHWIAALHASRRGNTLQTFPAPVSAPLQHVPGRPAAWAGMALISAINYSGGILSAALARNPDVFHISNLVRNPPPCGRLTTTLHDCTAWLMPDLHTARNAANDRRFARDILARCSGIIAVSANTRNDAIRLLNIEPSRIRTIYPGIAPSYFGVPDAHIAAARSRYNLTRPYCLYTGTIEPRKNLDRLLDAWSSTTPDVRAQYDLVLAGMPGWNSAPTLARLQGFRYLGYVPEAFMPGLTAGATAMAYPSLYEGFGFPVAQAMAAGTPVLTSALSSLPEIAGTAALLVDPLSAAELRLGLEKLLLDSSLRQTLRLRGLTRAAEFTWERAALESWNFFTEQF